MDYDSVVNYFNDIVEICDSLDGLSFHSKSKYKRHQKFGTYVYSYNRNKNTTWYIIYEKYEDIISIYRIMNNYLTNF